MALEQRFSKSCNFILIWILWLPFLRSGVATSEFTKCCSEGRRAYTKYASCPADLSSSVGSVFGSSCSRLASICCLRALFVVKCTTGEKRAHSYTTCTNDNGVVDYGGGFERECCECCLLGKQTLQERRRCEVLPSFDNVCQRAFKSCCKANKTNLIIPAITGKNKMNSQLAVNGGNRCLFDNPCQQLCEDVGSLHVQCACNPGYQLNADLKTCSDVNECLNVSLSSSNMCHPTTERCVNTEGSYECLPVSSNHNCPSGMIYSANQCIDVDECDDAELICDLETELCVNTIGSYECQCKPGFAFNTTRSKCTDVDECVLERDNTCSVGQRCINTVGSYRCIRTLSCGTGYYLDSETEDCKDIDECTLNTHNCGPAYTCRNTRGSFRCEKRKCPQGQILDRRTGKCKLVKCDAGFTVGTDGRCHDIDECSNPNACLSHQLCTNTPGSFHCTGSENACRKGFEMDQYTSQCIDIDECQRGTHLCSSRKYCRNTEGSHRCDCPSGYSFNPATHQCDDIDECMVSSGNVCSLQATCENTLGSFKCKCNPGYRLSSDHRSCEDIDECQSSEATCQQRCVNVPGSYYCAYDRGYTLGTDGRSCQDIDECAMWNTHGASLCMGSCINTPGSYSCHCPPGYHSLDGDRTCEDIDECAQGICHGDDRICVNTLGSFKCHMVHCPQNYVRDSKYKK